MERAKLTGLYEYCWMLKPPKMRSAHVPYNLLINLAKVAPEGVEAGFIRQKLEAYGYLREGDEGLDRRIERALNWVEDFGEAEIQKVELTSGEAGVLRKLIQALLAAKDEEGYQSSVFDVARAEGIRPRALFQVLYRILIGRPQGPRFGPYVSVIGKDNVVEKLEEALKDV